MVISSTTKKTKMKQKMIKTKTKQLLFQRECQVSEAFENPRNNILNEFTSHFGAGPFGKKRQSIFA